MNIGFIGLGIMGRPMAGHLLAAGHQLTVWNRSQPGMNTLKTMGAKIATSPQDVASQSDIVFTMVGDSTDVEAIAFGAKGIIKSAKTGLIHIDMSTIAPEVSHHIASRYAENDIEFLDAPVSGGEAGAVNATLSIMVGGREELFQRCLPLLQLLGKTITYCGTAGAGQTVKLCNQVLVAVTNMAVCEAVTLAKKAGVDAATMIAAVQNGAAASWQLTNLAPRMLAEDFSPGFKIDHQQKDLRLALEVADKNSLALPATTLVKQLFTALQAQGLGQEGTQALVKIIH